MRIIIPHAERWRELDIQVNHHDTPCMIGIALDVEGVRQAPRLEKLAIVAFLAIMSPSQAPRPNHGVHLNLPSAFAPQLQTLHMTGVSPQLQSANFATITSLVLTHCPLPIQIGDLYTALSASCSIKTITLRDVEVLSDPQFSSPHSITLQHLQYLDLDTPSHSTVTAMILRLLCAPALRLLTLGEYWMKDDPMRTHLEAVGSGVSGYSHITWTDVERAVNDDPHPGFQMFQHVERMSMQALENCTLNTPVRLLGRTEVRYFGAGHDTFLVPSLKEVEFDPSKLTLPRQLGCPALHINRHFV